MDFIIGLPKSAKQNNATMVVVEILSKAAHFILVKSTFKEIDIVSIFMKEIFSFHGILKEIISNRDTKFTSNLWKYLMVGFETKLLFSTTYPPKTNGQIERVNQVL
jgi:hypothetical protein